MKKNLEISKINNLVELFFNQYKNQSDKNKILLSSLKEPKKDYSWRETFNSINKLVHCLGVIFLISICKFLSLFTFILPI